MKKIISTILCVALLISVVISSTSAATVKVTSISVDKSNLSMYIGDIYKMSVSLKPTNANLSSVKFSSNNSKIATVSADGTIKAIADGKAVISVASSANSKVIAKSNITVMQYGWQKNKNKKRTISWYFNDSEPGIWGQDATSKYITEKTGITVDFQINPSPWTDDRVSVMIAAGNLPDILSVGWWEPYIGTMADAGKLWSYDDLANTYDKSFWNVIDKSTFSYFKKDNKKTYQLNNWTVSIEQAKKANVLSSQDSFMVREDMYNAIGKPSMKTPSDFLNALKKVQERYPSISGKPVIPFILGKAYSQGGLSPALLNFSRILGIRMDNDILDNNDFVKWMKGFRTAYSQGLMPQSVFIDSDEAIKEKIIQGRVFAVVGNNSDLRQPMKTLYDSNNKKKYISIVNQPAGSKPPRLMNAGSITGYLSAIIPKTTKDPERIINFLTYLRSEEGQKDVVYGPKSNLWTEDANGSRTWTNAGVSEFKKQKDVWAKGSGIGWVWNMQLSAFFRDKFQPTDLEEPYKSIVEFTKDKTVFEPQYQSIFADDNTPDKANEIKIQEYQGKTIVKMVTSSSTAAVDAAVREYKKFRNDNGYAALRKIYDNKIKANEKLFGID